MSITISENTISQAYDHNNPMITEEISDVDEYKKNLEFRRWFILLVFVLIQYKVFFTRIIIIVYIYKIYRITNGGAWATYVGITDQTMTYYSASLSDVLWLANVFLVIYLTLSFLVIYHFYSYFYVF